MSRRTYQRWNEADTYEAEELWAAGATIPEIAERLGREEAAVRYKLGRRGAFSDPGYRRWTRERCLTSDVIGPRPDGVSVIRLWAEGYATDEIAARLGVSELAVIDVAVGAGLMEREDCAEFGTAAWYVKNEARAQAGFRAAGLTDRAFA